MSTGTSTVAKKITKQTRKAKATRNTNTAENPIECPICFDKSSETLCFPCKHDICKSCYRNPKLTRCPLCRMDRNGKTGEEQRENETTDRPQSISVSIMRLGDLTPSEQQQLPVAFHHSFIGGSGGSPLDIPGLRVNMNPLEAFIRSVNHREH